MNLLQTVIEEGGVMRCCIATVAMEYEGKEIKIGDTSHCHKCKTKFILVEPKDAGITCYRNLTKPIWKPVSQLKGTK